METAEILAPCPRNLYLGRLKFDFDGRPSAARQKARDQRYSVPVVGLPHSADDPSPATRQLPPGRTTRQIGSVLPTTLRIPQQVRHYRLIGLKESFLVLDYRMWKFRISIWRNHEPPTFQVFRGEISSFLPRFALMCFGVFVTSWSLVTQELGGKRTM